MRLGVAALVLSVAAACGGPGDGTAPPRNLLLITLDSVRADRFEHPLEYVDLPLALEHFRGEALVFDGVSSAPATLPAVAALLTGRHPRELGRPAPNRRLPDDVPTLAERFAAAGYDTAAFVAPFDLAGDTGIARGFATYEAPSEFRLEDYEVTQAARTWLARPERADRPWFVWVHLNAAHGPYSALETAFNPLNFFHKAMVPLPRDRDRKLGRSRNNSGRGGLPDYQRLSPPALFGRYRAAYDARVRVGDWFANELRHVLKFTDQYASTAIAVIGTHGEELGEHGVEFDHGEDLHGEVLRVPYLLRVPGLAGVSDAGLASQVDFAPTVARLFELPGIEGSGHDLLASEPAAPVAFSELWTPVGAGPATAIRTEEWFLLRDGDEPPVAYDLAADPGEQRPLPARDTPAARGLLRRLEELEALPVPPVQRVPLSSGDHVRLHALGYVLGRFE